MKSTYIKVGAALAAVLLTGTTINAMIGNTKVETTVTESVEATTVRSPAMVVAKMTGIHAVTDTEAQYGIGGTDLGILWDNGAGEILTAFGDTYSNAVPGGRDWRCNSMLRSEDNDLSDGISFSSGVIDGFRSKQLLPCGKDLSGGSELTAIPTSGIAIEGRQYMSYMSIRAWGDPGEWQTNLSQIAYSDDNGETWATDGPIWENTADGTHPFQMMAFAHHGGWVYLFGTPNGRLGNAHIARTRPDAVLNKEAYEYWVGDSWRLGDALAATPIIKGQVAELSVQYNEYSGRWIAIYLANNRDIVLRSAGSPTGPWGEATVIANADDYPQLYGGFIHPWSKDGDIHFTLSEWNTYNTYLMKVSLSRDGSVVAPNILGDPNFERQNTKLGKPWKCEGSCGVDTALGSDRQFSGTKSLWLRGDSSHATTSQTVPVTTHTLYTLTAFVRTGDMGEQPISGTLGVRQPGAESVMAESSFTLAPGYERHQVVFDSEDNTAVEVFVGGNFDANDQWINADTFALVATKAVP